MAKLTAEELIDAFKELTLVELSDFIKKFEEEFDVEAAAPVAAVAAAPAAGGEAPADEAKTEFDVILEAAGDKKVQVIKAVKAITGEGLKDTKDKVEGAPTTILSGVSKEDAEKAKADIEATGGTVTVK